MVDTNVRLSHYFLKALAYFANDYTELALSEHRHI